MHCLNAWGYIFKSERKEEQKEGRKEGSKPWSETGKWFFGEIMYLLLQSFLLQG